MKKIVASLATGIMIAGASFMTVSAETYDVNAGDTLWNIANENNTTVDNLMDINDLDSNMIYPNQKLELDLNNNDSDTNTNTNTMYVVKKGDTLYGISNEFGVSVKNIKSWNDLSSNLILIDQELDVKGVSKSESNETKQANTQETEKQEVQTEKTQEKTNESTKQESSEEKAEPAQETSKSEDTNQSPEGKTVSVSATAYTADCYGCSGITATGVDLNSNPNAKVIAVDPSVIPLGSEVYVEGYGYATAADTGGAINGNKIDLHVPTKDEAYAWGVRTVNVTIVK